MIIFAEVVQGALDKIGISKALEKTLISRFFFAVWMRMFENTPKYEDFTENCFHEKFFK